MIKIEIDPEVYNQLQELAKPFEDTPNTVLRKLFFDSRLNIKQLVLDVNTYSRKVSAGEILKHVFPESVWSKVGRLRNLFESDNESIYLLRFDKSETKNMWFRIPTSAYDQLLGSEKKSSFLFVNWFDMYCFHIPLPDLENRVSELEEDFLPETINIDPQMNRLRELDWSISKYFRQIKP